jgi:hypothetical protein
LRGYLFPKGGSETGLAKGFVATRFGSEQLATTIKDNKIQQSTTVVQFMTEDKLQPLSNPLTVKLVFGQKIGSTL